VTPARLGLHEELLGGASVRSTVRFGNYDVLGDYQAAPAGTRDLELEEAVFGAARFMPRGQASVLVPWIQNHRATQVSSEWGGRIGDVNLAARYDFLRARESRVVPGIGLLGGLTLPTGRPVEKAKRPLATDATGLGAYQANLGLALEQAWGPWTVGVTGLVAVRALRRYRGVEHHAAPEYTALGAVSYSWDSGVGVGGTLTYAVEGDASVNGVRVPWSARRATTAGVVAVIPLLEHWRGTVGSAVRPPISELGVNQYASLSVSVGLIGVLP
jgi:hypothetical protein